MNENEITIAGKTVAGVSYPDSTEHGFSIMFTDGTVLNIRELMQAGAIVATYEGQEIQSEEKGFHD
jgi:hypothetical protein